MKSTPDCIYCYLRQAHNCIRNAGVTEEKHPEILYGLMDMIKDLDPNRTPCFNSTLVIKKTYEICGTTDPFTEEKNKSNELAAGLLKSMKTEIEGADLHHLFKISSAGNIIDSGIVFDYDIDKTMHQTIKEGFSIDHFDIFNKMLKNSSTILYLGDNCGEIVFDMPVVRFLHNLGKRIHYAVKSEPALNDALVEDAVFAGIDKYADVIETGSGFLGVNLEDSSDGFKKMMNNADIIISKGQANFESLDDMDGIAGKTFFILKIKCERVAEQIKGSSMGDSVFYMSGSGGR